jgi:hypothetical protein
MANYDNVAPWVVVLAVIFTIGRAFIGFPGWLRRRLSRGKH